MTTEELTLEAYRASLRQPKTPRTTPTEAQEQEALIQWRDACAGQEPRLALLFHVPNGGKRDKGVAGQMRAAGVVAGVPDLWLPVRGVSGHGLLVIELKAEGGRVSDEQDTWIRELRNQGHYAAVCWGWLDAAQLICWYLGIDSGALGLTPAPPAAAMEPSRVSDRAIGTSPHSEAGGVMSDETPRPKRKGGTPKCPLCGLRRIKNCNGCYWSQGCCREEKRR